MQPGKSKSTISLTNRLLTGLVGLMIYRVISLSLSVGYVCFFSQRKVQISTNISLFYSYLFLLAGVFIFVFISGKLARMAVAMGSILFLGLWMYNQGLPYRALLFVLSAIFSYSYVFMRSYILEHKPEVAYSKAIKYAQGILLISYPIYLFYEDLFIRNVSLFIACLVISTFFISWLNVRLGRD